MSIWRPGRGEKVKVSLSWMGVGILEMCLRGLFSKSQRFNGDSEQLTWATEVNITCGFFVCSLKWNVSSWPMMLLPVFHIWDFDFCPLMWLISFCPSSSLWSKTPVLDHQDFIFARFGYIWWETLSVKPYYVRKWIIIPPKLLVHFSPWLVKFCCTFSVA